MSQTNAQIRGLDKLLLKLKNGTRAKTIMAGLNLAALSLVRSVRNDWLRGPRPKKLGVVTGRLRSSISRKPAVKRGSRYSSAIGTNVRYAPIHEFGFEGLVNIGAHTRKAFGRIINVRSHGRRVNLPARPFLRPAINDPRNITKATKIVQKRIVTAIKAQK